jgi:hypothetical protein
MIDPNDLLAGQQAANYAGFTRARLYTLARQGRIGKQIAGVWFFTRAELDAYKQSPKNKGGRPKQAAGPLMVASPA